MGNCLVLQDKLIKVMKSDGSIIEYKPPLKVHQLLSEHDGHAISDALPIVRILRPEAEMLAGGLYFLLPLPVPQLKFDKKMFRDSDPTGEGSGGVVRIKVVISKKELEMMLRKGRVSVGDLVSNLQKKESANELEDKVDGDGNGNCKVWKPVLESIPEL